MYTLVPTYVMGQDVTLKPVQCCHEFHLTRNRCVNITFSLNEIRLKMSSTKRCQFRLGLTVLWWAFVYSQRILNLESWSLCITIVIIMYQIFYKHFTVHGRYKHFLVNNCSRIYIYIYTNKGIIDKWHIIIQQTTDMPPIAHVAYMLIYIYIYIYILFVFHG